jgi:putative membrane protein
VDQDERTLLARERTSLANERNKLANERNRLANERTFLAWVRTGLASVGGGLAIIRFLTFQDRNHQILAQIIGCLLVALGISLFILSFFDYKHSYQKLRIKDGYAGSVASMSAIAFVLTIVSISLLLIAFKLIEELNL